MNPNVTYNPDVGQADQRESGYTTSGINLGFPPKDIFQGLTEQEAADAKVMLDMLVHDIEKHVKQRMQGNPNVRY